MKLDDDVKMISAEAPVLFSKAAELFITELTLRAWIHTEDNKRRTLQRNDIAMAISKYDQFDFLIDIVPRDELKPHKAREEPAASKPSPNLPDQVNFLKTPQNLFIRIQHFVNRSSTIYNWHSRISKPFSNQHSNRNLLHWAIIPYWLVNNSQFKSYKVVIRYKQLEVLVFYQQHRLYKRPPPLQLPTQLSQQTSRQLNLFFKVLT